MTLQPTTAIRPTAEPAVGALPAGECLRCGYSLIGIANDQPCPECGLIAERSRRMSDALHDTRPRWLRLLSWGVWLMLLAILFATASQLLQGRIIDYARRFYRANYDWYQFLSLTLPAICMSIAAVFLCAGVILLSVREGYPPADQNDRWLRVLLRLTPIAMLVSIGCAQFQAWVDWHYPRYLQPSPDSWQPAEVTALIFGIVGIYPLPMLVFIRLRGLAKRARSAHLAEHCLIVGVGATLALLYAGGAWIVVAHADEWFGERWLERSRGFIVVMLICSLLAALFVLWSFYLLIRFGLAFAHASRQLRRKWKAGDRAAAELTA